MLTGATSCTPDDHELSAPVVSSDELVEGIAFSVTPDASDPNTIHLKSLVKGATPVWKTPTAFRRTLNSTSSSPSPVTMSLPSA